MRIQLADLATALALIASTSLAAPANADDDSGWYIGAGLGEVDYGERGQIRTNEEILLATQHRDSGDPLSSSVSLWVGYRINRYLSIETGYIDNTTREFTLTNDADENVGTFSFHTEGATLAVVGGLPFGKWEPYARLGVFFAATEGSIRGPSGTLQWANRERSAELLTSLGLAYNFTAHWQAKLEGTYVPDAGGPVEADTEVVTVGFTYRF